MPVNDFYKRLVVKAISEDVKGFRQFFFEESPTEKISYAAGQYLTFVQQGEHEEIRRSYSMTSSPVLNEPLAIGFKRISNGVFSRYLADHVREGDELTTIGSAGFFVLPEDIGNYRSLFFLAAGSGITPIFSLIKTALFQYPHLSIILVYSSHAQNQIIFYHELVALQHQYKHQLQIEFVCSDSVDLFRAHLHKELLEQFLRKYVKHKAETMFYVCGPKNYTRMCVFTLAEQLIPAEHIKKETFVTSKTEILKQEPWDKSLHTVRIDFNGRTTSLPVQYPTSILQMAKLHQLSLPYSCETGKCGSCAAKCIKGKVWMSYNEVLTERELQNGLVLTCTGFPVDGDVELEY
jgi:ferredoxin-NADP reductase